MQDYAYLDIPDEKKMTMFEFIVFYKWVSKEKDGRSTRALTRHTMLATKKLGTSDRLNVEEDNHEEERKERDDQSDLEEKIE